MRLPMFALLLSTGLLAACSGSSPSTAPTAAPTAGGPTVPPSAAATAASTAAGTRIEVTLTDGLAIEPAAITVQAGVPVTFVVTNSGALDHEFYLGDEEAQAAHAAEMATMGGMAHDEPEGIAVDPGQTKELTYTFTEAGQTLAGCHVQGHYLAGMKAVITVE